MCKGCWNGHKPVPERSSDPVGDQIPAFDVTGCMKQCKQRAALCRGAVPRPNLVEAAASRNGLRLPLPGQGGPSGLRGARKRQPVPRLRDGEARTRASWRRLPDQAAIGCARNVREEGGGGGGKEGGGGGGKGGKEGGGGSGKSGKGCCTEGDVRRPRQQEVRARAAALLLQGLRRRHATRSASTGGSAAGARTAAAKAPASTGGSAAGARSAAAAASASTVGGATSARTAAAAASASTGGSAASARAAAAAVSASTGGGAASAKSAAAAAAT